MGRIDRIRGDGDPEREGRTRTPSTPPAPSLILSILFILVHSPGRQMILFGVERRKAWRMLQSKAGVVNRDYLAQKALLGKVDRGEVLLAEARARTRELLATEVAAVR